MKSFSIANTYRSAALPGALNRQLTRHLIREDGQEDLCFALYHPSTGRRRVTALMADIILPGLGDRQIHGNVSFNPQYFERVCAMACREGMGVAFLHSHPGPGFQRMSPDDIAAESRMARAVEALTDLPLLGLTVGNDGTWSARFWQAPSQRHHAPKAHWCHSVRISGPHLRVTFNNDLVAAPQFRELFRHTIAVWGSQHHRNLARLKIGIVGLGSVGALVATMLVRMGFTNMVLIDFDEVQAHNLDRLDFATLDDIGVLKVQACASYLRKAATAHTLSIQCVPFSVAEPEGYRAALDCDILFSCVDRPRPRSILNHFAYAHLIPVIDGGIQVRFRRGDFSGADWQVQTVGPERPCLDCLGAFNPSDVETEKAGMLDDPSYLQGLPADHRFRRNENVYPFSSNLASLEVFHLIALATGAGGVEDFGVQRFRYMPGVLDQIPIGACHEHCLSSALVARGDRDFCLEGLDVSAEAARRRQTATPRRRNWFRQVVAAVRQLIRSADTVVFGTLH